MTANTASLVVVAAGVGRRLGAPVNKALVKLNGRPLVDHTLRHLLTDPRLDPVVLVGHADDRPTLTALVAELPRPVTLTDGGARRQDSVAAGLAALPDDAPDVVLVHDAARPFVPLERLGELIDGAREQGCAILAVPLADTIKQAQADAPQLVERTVPREGLWAAQTPQAFRRADLAGRLAQAGRDGLSVTDEARLFESAGLAVLFVEGSRRNFKVTTGEDLTLARALLGGSSEDH